jgi:hypothetical protein
MNRRRVLATAGGLALAGMAGCSSLTEQSFEASPVVLPESARQEMVLSETGREAETITRDGPTGNVEVSITSHAAVYRRGPARGAPTVIERFVSDVNGTAGAGAALNVLATDLGVEEARLAVSEEEVPIPSNQFSLVIPDGMRGSDGIALDQTLALVPGPAVDTDTVTYSGDAPGAFFPDDVYFPSEIYFPDDVYFPSEIYFPGDIYSPDRHGPAKSFVPDAESFTNRVGMDGLPEGAERVNPGTTIDTANTVFAGPGDVLFASEIHDKQQFPSDIYDGGVHLPLGGSTFGLGVLATPDASVGGQSANPLVDIETGVLLQRDAAKRVLARTGLTDAETVEWLAGPQPLELAGDEGWGNSFMGKETAIASFAGVVNGEDGPWGLVMYVARITDDDHVIAAAGIARPVATADAGMTAVAGSGWGMDTGSGLLDRAGEFTDEVFGELRRM